MNARYDFFSPIHKAIRSILFDLAISAGRSGADDASVHALALKFDLGLDMLEEHAGIEDREVIPLLTRAAPFLAKSLSEEHERLSKIALLLQASVCNLASTPAESRAPALREIYVKANELVAGHLAHMHREETEVNEALWRVYDDGELLGLTKRAVASIPPERMAQWSEAMAKAYTPAELELVRKARQAAAA